MLTFTLRSLITSDAEKRLEQSRRRVTSEPVSASFSRQEIRAARALGAEQQARSIRGLHALSEYAGSAVAALRRGDIPDIDQPLDTGTEVKPYVPALTRRLFAGYKHAASVA